MFEFASSLFDTDGFVPRSQCGAWTPFLMWSHIISDLVIWFAYLSIPIVLLTFVRRKNLPYPRLFVLFAAFILACGTVHLIEAIIFVEPIYRFSALVKVVTAAVSVATVIALAPVVRRVFADDSSGPVAAMEPRGFGVRGVSPWLTTVFVFAILVLAANTAVSSYNISKLIYNDLLVTNTRVVKQELTDLMSDLKDAETGHRGFLITDREEYLEPFKEGTQSVQRRADNLAGMISTNSSQLLDLEQLNVLIAKKIAEMKRTIRIHKSEGKPQAQSELIKGEGKTLMDGIRVLVDRMQEREDRMLTERATIARHKYRATTVSALLGGGIALGMVVLGYGLIRWELGRRVAAESALKQREADLTLSEATLRAFYDSAPAYMGIVELQDNDILHVYDNAASCRFFGVETGATANRRESTLGVRSEVRDLWMEKYRESDATGRSVRFEYESGAKRWLSAAVSPVGTDPRGRRLFCYVAEDVTDQKRAVEALRDSEERWRLALDAAELGAWNIDPSSNALTTDSRFQTIFAGAVGPITYEEAFALIHPDDRERVRDAVAAATRPHDPIPYAAEYRVVHADGAVRWVFGKGRANFGGSGPDRRIVSFDGTVADITERKRAEDALRESEERFRNLADVAPALIWMSEPDQRRTYFNRTWLEFTGRKVEQEIGNGWVENLHPLDRDRYLEAYSRAFADGRPFELEYRLRRHDGEYRWVLARGTPRHTPSGSFAGFLGLCMDVTDRKIAQENLRQSEQRYRTLTEAIPQIVWNTDPRGEVTYFNRRWLDYTDLPVEKAHGQGWMSAVHPDDRERVFADWRNTITHPANGAAGDRFTNELRLRNAATDEYRWFLSVAVPLRGEDGAIDRWIGSMADIHDQKMVAETLERMVRERTTDLIDEIEERRRAEQQVRAVAAELERSNSELEQFAYIASHDLQEPLRKIQAFGDRLRTKYRDELPEPGREYVDRMHQSAARMRRLIDDLLNYSRVTTTARPFKRVDLGQLVPEVVADLDERINPTGGAVHVGEMPEIDADPTQMRQLFQNLIANAVKFHKPNVPPEIEVRAECVSALLPAGGAAPIPACRITVRDNGIGFDEKYLSRIFQVFQRLHGRNEYEGTGVGLAICRKIAERHGGTITAQSRIGEGATFVVTLPIRQPGEDATADVQRDQKTGDDSDGGRRSG